MSQYNGSSANRISKLSPDGNVTLHTDHALLNGPVGMAFDSTNTLYVANFTDGEIYQVTHNGDSLRLMANIPNVSFWGVGFLTYAGGYLFATGIGVHKIFKISLTGEVSEFAGTGIPGSVDGTADVAQFNRPNGITPNYQGDKLYVSDYGTESIREIISSQLTGIESLDQASNSPIHSIRSYPNPASEWMNVVYVLHRNSHVRLQFFSVEGRLYGDKVSTFQEQGTHQYKIDTSLLTPGIYYLRLTSDGYSTTVKVSVMH